MAPTKVALLVPLGCKTFLIEPAADSRVVSCCSSLQHVLSSSHSERKIRKIPSHFLSSRLPFFSSCGSLELSVGIWILSGFKHLRYSKTKKRKQKMKKKMQLISWDSEWMRLRFVSDRIQLVLCARSNRGNWKYTTVSFGKHLNGNAVQRKRRNTLILCWFFCSF